MFVFHFSHTSVRKQDPAPTLWPRVVCCDASIMVVSVLKENCPCVFGFYQPSDDEPADRDGDGGTLVHGFARVVFLPFSHFSPKTTETGTLASFTSL
jgi:hypothetical protein